MSKPFVSFHPGIWAPKVLELVQVSASRFFPDIKEQEKVFLLLEALWEQGKKGNDSEVSCKPSLSHWNPNADQASLDTSCLVFHKLFLKRYIQIIF